MGIDVKMHPYWVSPSTPIFTSSPLKLAWFCYHFKPVTFYCSHMQLAPTLSTNFLLHVPSRLMLCRSTISHNWAMFANMLGCVSLLTIEVQKPYGKQFSYEVTRTLQFFILLAFRILSPIFFSTPVQALPSFLYIVVGHEMHVGWNLCQKWLSDSS